MSVPCCPLLLRVEGWAAAEDLKELAVDYGLEDEMSPTEQPSPTDLSLEDGAPLSGAGCEWCSPEWCWVLLVSAAECCWACKGPSVLPDSPAGASGQVPLLLANCAASHSALQMPHEDAGLVDQSIQGE